MKKIKYISLVCCLFFISLTTVQAETIEQFKLTGTHTFQNEKADSWSVIQEKIDETSGKSKLKENFASAKGKEITVDLPKVGGKETIYHINATGENFSQKYEIRVFKPGRTSSFWYKSELNPDVRTYMYVPKTLGAKTRIILVMHGLSRNPDVYILSWERWAEKNDYIVIAPHFDDKNWKGSRMYNLGNILTSKQLLKRRAKWSFQVVADIQKEVKKGFGLEKDYFDIFGHSAGGQFVHRFMFLMVEAPVRVALTANSGWYTLPDLNVKYPYGYKHKKFSFTKEDLLNYTKRNVFILRGTEDTRRTSNLRQTEEADAQGENRYKRAEFMYKKIVELNPNTTWRLIDAPRIGHSQKGMAAAAQVVLGIINKNNQ